MVEGCQFLSHEFEGVGQVFPLLLLFDEVVDHFVVAEAPSESALALLVDLLEQVDQFALLAVQYPLQSHELR